MVVAGCGHNPTPRPTDDIASDRSIVLITIDTLRADRLGSYGSARGLTPALDRFAQRATRFTAAITQVPLTLAAHATLLTGLHPARHGVRTNDRFRLSADVPTVADTVRRRGYQTAAFIGGYPLTASSGLGRGFDRYDDEFLHRANRVERSADEVVDSALAWIDRGGAASHKAFVWLHLFDPHSPYTPPESFAAAYPGMPYDGEVAYTDRAIGRFFDELQRRGIFVAATVIVVADHGESLGEHGERTHGTFLYDSTLRVPLLIKLPDDTRGSDTPSSIAGDARPRVVDVPVEIADIAPTIAALAGAAFGPTDGRSLLPLIRGAAGDPDRPAYAESYYQNILLGWSPLRAVRTRRWKFVEAPRAELYDLDRDPNEQHNAIADRSALAAALQRDLPAGPDKMPVAAPKQPADSSERLRSLGYASGSTVPTPGAGAVDPKDRVEVWSAIEDGIDQIDRNPGGAERAFARALERDPRNGLAMKYLADIRFRAGRLREARDGYRRAISAGFRHPDVLVNLASIAEREGHLDDAQAALSDAVKLDTADADAWNHLGVIETRRGAVTAARQAYASAIAAAPDRAEPYYNLAIIERRSGNEAAAMDRLRDAIARNPAYPEAQYELGTGYLLARDPARALDAYRAALAARPDYAEALFGAGRAARDLGRTADARHYYEGFVRIAPAEYRQQVAAAREALRTLR
jgi:choline-sulfatase